MKRTLELARKTDVKLDNAVERKKKAHAQQELLFAQMYEFLGNGPHHAAKKAAKAVKKAAKKAKKAMQKRGD